MIINYRKKYIRTDLLVGSLYLISGVAGMIFQFSSYNIIISIFFLLGGFFFLSSCYYKKKYQYLHIKDGVLTCYIFGSKNKSIDLSQVTRIKKFADELTFLTLHEKLKISTNLIAKEDLPAFKNALAALNLEPNKNLFTKVV